jgi:hypothetical protein
MRSAFTFVSLVALGSLVFSACGGDDDAVSSVGGSAGSGAKAGKSGKGGGAGKGSAGESTGGAEDGGATTTGGGSGKGGSNATGGSSGKGGRGGTGNGTGGTAGTETSTGGTLTTGGTSGSGGTSTAGTTGGGTGGLVGSSGDGSGGGGEGGGPEAGAGGQGNTQQPHAELCAYHCTDSTQCGAGSICHAGVCVTELAKCDADNDCVPFASFWNQNCTSDADCSGGRICVAAAGLGWCAIVAAPDCYSGAPVTLTKFGSTDPATVCGVPGVCQRHSCATTCAVDDDCYLGTLGTGPACNTTTHFCGGCTSDLDCYGAGVTHCDVPTGTCQCASNNDCTDPLYGVMGTDTCVNGTCGCSSASTCTAYPSATAACE